MTRPIIGSAYTPHRFSRRTPLEYSELRPAITGDAAVLQRALIGRRRAVAPGRLVGRLCAVLLGVAVVALVVGWV